MDAFTNVVAHVAVADDEVIVAEFAKEEKVERAGVEQRDVVVASKAMDFDGVVSGCPDRLRHAIERQADRVAALDTDHNRVIAVRAVDDGSQQPARLQRVDHRTQTPSELIPARSFSLRCHGQVPFAEGFDAPLPTPLSTHSATMGGNQPGFGGILQIFSPVAFTVFCAKELTPLTAVALQSAAG